MERTFAELMIRLLQVKLPEIIQLASIVTLMVSALGTIELLQFEAVFQFPLVLKVTFVVEEALSLRGAVTKFSVLLAENVSFG